ncbi:putative peroxisomal membrane anchor protein [Cryphonectria parasitica EP155]|uniref:Peroxisomal membrane protein PEX14 n=1 Tax=Cryphonectria parasitica (strain ATCC 38755 / EP155) TaxID=660469 RepID=A0A9P4XWW7_CRYP1|nr:putative peroxisomal membrane anchor protein [Cryphonectria parasitica EP155]KAF3762060.1 putative peroxisomal membrane anchor protein [Cryphonectria parasitica EP155]
MPIREELVASAAQFLQDPSVAASPVENRIAFLKAKNLTEEEIQASLARAAGEVAPVATYAAVAPPPAGHIPGQPPAYYGGGYPPYGWQPPPPEVPRRDWRDWFIMATVVGGVGYGLYALGKRYVYPLIAPPTPEQLETDKKSIDEQFEKAFTLVDQLSKDTEALKTAEQQRTEKLDSALAELETVINDLKSASRRREDETQRVRDDVSNLKDSIPKALDAQKSLTDTRLQEVNAELKSLKTIISQRMTSGASSGAANSYGSRGTMSPAPAPTPAPASTPIPALGHDSSSNGTTDSHAAADKAAKPTNAAPSSPYQEPGASNGRASPFSSGITAAAVKIPEWQRAMASKRSNSSSLNNNTADAGGSAQQAEAGSSES